MAALSALQYVVYTQLSECIYVLMHMCVCVYVCVCMCVCVECACVRVRMCLGDS